jgi:RNA recognition motif-containing protein
VYALPKARRSISRAGLVLRCPRNDGILSDAGLLYSPRFLLILKDKRRDMSTKLYVGNLSFRTTSDDLKEAFSQAGTVESASIIEDRETGRSRGFGFVEMATPEEAAAAIEQFNGKDLGGRNLTVNEAKPKSDRGGRGGTGGTRGNYGGGYGGGGGGGRDRDGGNFGGGGGGRNDREPRW